MSYSTDDELLRGRSLHELEDAERRLRTHIKKRRGAFKPSTPRRIVGLIISILLISIGLAVATHALTGAEHFMKLMIFSGGVIVMGIMWIYSDWFE